MLFSSFEGMRLLLLAKIHPPDLVNHTFVEFGDGLPFEI